eukprot:TRINITY_DN2907_c0_g1_i1.p1 TRINITY_DN2907_c0_g1~~TRINITY_DN2907_c0_g1_i1.p1  ORF type:complete len:418 (+),score=-66.11 TRINITY_DN2907_c0_g1_i1:245-1498(+)
MSGIDFKNKFKVIDKRRCIPKYICWRNMYKARLPINIIKHSFYIPSLKRPKDRIGGGLCQLGFIIPKYYKKIVGELGVFPDKEWRLLYTSSEYYSWLHLGTPLTNEVLEKFSPFLASMQKIIWHATPEYLSDSSIDIIHKNRGVRPFINRFGDPSSLEKTALVNGIITIHDVGAASIFAEGRFRFPLQRSLKTMCPTMPWFLKLNLDRQKFYEEKEIISKFLSIFSLPSSWKKRISCSTWSIADGSKFTAQFQISTRLIKFFYPCNNCGILYNNIIHAFVDCHFLRTVRYFIQLNVFPQEDIDSNIIKASILFGPFRRKQKLASHHKAIEYSLLSIKSLIAKKLTNHSYIKIEDLRAIMIGTAARYCAMAIKIPSVSASSWTCAGDLIRFIPSNSLQYLNIIKSTIRRHRRYRLNRD